MDGRSNQGFFHLFSYKQFVAGHFVKNLYLSLMKRLYRLSSKPRVADRLGARWMLTPDDWIDNRILIGRAFERSQLAFAEQCMIEHKAQVFYDCGANIGLYSVILGLKSTQLQEIHAFEPVPSTWARLVANIGLNGLATKVHAHKYGLGDSSELLTIAIDAKSSGTATLDQTEKANPKRNFSLNQQVQIHAFDSRFKEKGQRAFFKIDLEGHEARALEGMKNYLADNKCVVQIELWPRNRPKTVEWFKRMHYSVINEIENDVYFSNDPKGFHEQSETEG